MSLLLTDKQKPHKPKLVDLRNMTPPFLVKGKISKCIAIMTRIDREGRAYGYYLGDNSSPEILDHYEAFKIYNGSITIKND